jgi:hypothetical protein
VTPLDCSELQDAAAELALGILPGDQRADALAHLDRCHDCGLVVAELAHAVDTIVAATPPTSPPRGFSRRVTKGLVARRRPRLPRAVLATAATAVLIVALVSGARQPGNPSLPSRQVTGAALAAPGVRMAGLDAIGGEHIAGVVFVQTSEPSWVFMTVTDDEESSTYVCELEYGDGRTVKAGSFSIRNGAGTWRQDLVAGRGSVTRVDVRTPEGRLVGRASFQ